MPARRERWPGKKAGVRKPEYRLALRQADQAREDFAILLDELDFLKLQLSRLPTRAWFSRMWLIGLASVWALLAVIVLLLVR